MKKVMYNKLIADNIPEKMTSLQKQFEVRVITDDAEYERELLKKVVEEAQELEAAPSKEEAVKEIADMLNVIDTLIAHQGISQEDLQRVKAERKEKKGGFLKRLFLLWSEDDGYEARKGN